LMTTKGQSIFNLELSDIVEEAFERAGLELRTGYDLRTARRSINLMTIEWANRGINLWTIEQGQITMQTGQPIYPLPLDTIDLLDTVVRTNNTTTNQIDINITRISESTYITIPNKLTQGRPIQVWINRQSGQENPTTVTLVGDITTTDTTITLSSTYNLATTGFIKIGAETIGYANVNGNQLVNCYRAQANTVATPHTTGSAITVQNLPSINVWPSPNAPGDQYTFVYYRLRRVQDAGDGINTQDIPFRFLPCMVAGLAYFIAMKKPEVDGQRVLALKAAYDEQFQLAADEDREKAPSRYVPRQLFY
jgi:hypothetical protein